MDGKERKVDIGVSGARAARRKGREGGIVGVKEWEEVERGLVFLARGRKEGKMGVRIVWNRSTRKKGRGRKISVVWGRRK